MVLTGWSAFWVGLAAVVVAGFVFSTIENIVKTILVTRCINKTVKAVVNSTLPEEQLKKLIDALVED